MVQQVEELRKLAEKILRLPFNPGQPLAGGGSERDYFRFSVRAGKEGAALGGDERSVVGVIGRNLKENRAFLGFTRHFLAQGLPVPRVFGADDEGGMYLMEDLGDLTLAIQLAQWRQHPLGKVMAMASLSRVVGWLARFQVHGGQDLDYGLCCEGQEMDGPLFEADLDRFLMGYIPQHAPGIKPGDQVLGELDAFVLRLETVPREYFCYRDYQTRNIMWRDGPVFLDYQSGRRGALQYDLASFLYSPDTGLTEKERDQLTDIYLNALKECGLTIDKYAFLADFHPFVLMRRLQALGAYAHLAKTGRQNYLEKIPPTLKELQNLLNQDKLNFGLPALEEWLGKLCQG